MGVSTLLLLYWYAHTPLNPIVLHDKRVFESDSRNSIPLSHTHTPLVLGTLFSTGQQTFGDNRVHAFVIVVVHISLNLTLLQDESCGQFQVGTPPLSLLYWNTDIPLTLLSYMTD